MLTTTCPACLTTHRVSEAQLAMRQGLVRCRQCAVVFNAHDMLREASEDAALPEPEDFPPQAETLVNASAERGGVQALDEPPWSIKGRSTDQPEGGPPPLASGGRLAGQSPPRSIGAGLVLLGGLLLLGAQLALIERTTLQRQFPEFYAGLARMCRPLGCLSEPVRLVEAVEIKGSALDALAGDRARLSVTLANRGPLDLAWPHLVLTLQDAQGERLALRTLAPIDYLTAEAAPLLRAGSEAEWRVLLGLGEARPVGYSLAVLYP